MKKLALSLILTVFMLATASLVSAASSNYAIAAGAVATSTSLNSQTYGPAMVGGALVGAGPKSGIGITPTDVYDPILGDALIYGYYNVRNNAMTVFTVLNTDRNNGARVRIRFIEGKNSNEVLDYDICLSPADQYTGYIYQGTASVPSVKSVSSGSTDDTYIDYGTTRGSTSTVTPSAGIPFKTTAAIEDTTNDITEGYFIVIAENQLATSGTSTQCGSYYDTTSDVGNVLSGQSYIIFSSGKTYAYTATALANFSDSVFTDNPTAATPNLASTTDRAGLDAVNFVLTKENIRSQYWNLSGTNGTQAIITFPTRALTVKSGSEDDIFDDKKVLLSIWDDRENSNVSGCTYSPCGTASDLELPNEVNVLKIGTGNVFNTNLGVTVSSDYTVYSMGWFNINFVYSNSESPVAIGTGEYHRTPFNNAQVNYTITPSTSSTGLTTNDGYVSWGMPVIAYVVSDVGGGINWMLPMNYTTYVNDGTTTAPAP